MSKVSEYFGKIEGTISEKADTALEIAEIYQFNITGDDTGSWTINLKEGPSCTPGESADSTCVITLADEDFIGLITGEKNGMELFATGKLKIEKDAMAAMKLERLFKM
jgi:putative sterol carrier protein